MEDNCAQAKRENLNHKPKPNHKYQSFEFLQI